MSNIIGYNYVRPRKKKTKTPQLKRSKDQDSERTILKKYVQIVIGVAERFIPPRQINLIPHTCFLIKYWISIQTLKTPFRMRQGLGLVPNFLSLTLLVWHSWYKLLPSFCAGDKYWTHNYFSANPKSALGWKACFMYKILHGTPSSPATVKMCQDLLWVFF